MGQSVHSIFLSQTVLPLFGFISDFSVLFPNNKPLPNSSITTSPESSDNAVTPVKVVIFSYAVYSGSNGDRVQYPKVNGIGQKFAPKQWVSARLSVSVEDYLQITLLLFLFTLLINQSSLVLILNIVLFPFPLGKRSYSQYRVTWFPRWS